jgi:two-component system, OmpR family, catabolic regulation response regulator CreB
MSSPLVLLVEDDPAIARSVVYTLERDGLAVSHSLQLLDARRQMALRTPDILILDIGLPDGSGLDWCRQLRSSPASCNLPILLLSAQGEEIDRVLGLEFGADDYVTKPFSPRELLARVRSMLRRSRMLPTEAPAALSSAVFTIDAAGQRVSLNQQPLNLTRREYGLLADLLQHRGRIRSRDALLTSVWGMASDSLDRTVDTHIKTLRAKLLQADPSNEHIVTHRGMGYSIEL